MFLHREHDPNGPFAIPQTSHAWLAWQIAEHWGNRRFARAAPRAEVLAAAMLHDSGWVAFDVHPSVDETGRPRTFDRMEVTVHLDIWRDCVRRAGLHARYAGLLVASHFAGLAERKTQDLLDRGETDAARSVQVFRAEMERLQAGWEEELATDARYETCLRGTGRAINAQILESVDRISVHLCANLGSPFRADGLSPAGDTLPIEFEAVDATTWRVSPWPLEGDRLRVQVEGRRLPRARFERDDVLHEALARARVSRLTFQLLRPSAS